MNENVKISRTSAHKKSLISTHHTIGDYTNILPTKQLNMHLNKPCSIPENSEKPRMPNNKLRSFVNKPILICYVKSQQMVQI